MRVSIRRYGIAFVNLEIIVRKHLCNRYFGGIAETVKIDNLKVGINEANFYEPVVQRTYATFAAHYGFWAQPCRVKTPTDKGMVEKAIDYIKDNCFKGREFKDIEYGGSDLTVEPSEFYTYVAET